jgi:RNA polymerase sigma factor (sigma-70 family)
MTPRHLLEPARLAGGALLKAQSDSRLVDMTRAGNDRAFEAIVARYKDVLLRYCSRVLPDGRADDAVQQTFVNAYGALHGETTPLSLRSWLFGIAHNVSLNILRQRGSDYEPLEAHQGTEEPAHATLEKRERFREVLAAVAALPPGQRDAIVLRELEGRGHEEIARELGVTGGAARQLISRARNGVRQAAAAILPMPLLMRLTSGTAPSPTAERVAELTAVGGGMAVSKVVATGAIGATLLGGAVTGPDLVEGDRDRRDRDVAEAATSDTRESTTTDAEATDPGDDRSPNRSGGDDGQTRAADDDDDRSGSDDGADDEDDDNSGPGGGGDDDGRDHDDDDSSGPGPGGDDDDPDTDNSGPGSGGDQEAEHDNSGPGSGDDDTVETDNSGPGGDDAEPDEILEPDDDTSDGESGSSGSGTSGSGGSSGPG